VGDAAISFPNDTLLCLATHVSGRLWCRMQFYIYD